MTAINCVDVTKRYLHKSRVVTALDGVTFTAVSGEFLAVIGPSGSGKSTLVRLIAGLERPDSGTISRSSANKGDIGLVFQSNAVFPWRTVSGNLTFALESRGIPRSIRQQEAIRLSNLVGLDPEIFLTRYPRDLSGGEIRRVAIGMTLATGAKLMLFDEPTSQLDYLAKYQIGQTVQSLWMNDGFTALYVTHDLEEAILLGSRIILLNKGSVKDVISVGLPRPRTKATLDTREFADLRRNVLQRFEQ